MENNSQVPTTGSTVVRRYGIALLTAAGVIAVRVALMPLLGTRPPYITFYLGIVIAAAYGGMGPGLLVTFIGLAFGLAVLPAGPVVIAQEATRLGLYVLSGFGICLIAESMHRQRGRVQEQAQELGRAAERLAELDRAKTAFFSNVSHEFRTPLTLMLGPTEGALNSPGQALAGAELATVHRNALRLLKLVNTLLDFARIEAGRIDASYQPTDLSRLTADLASVFRSAVEKAGLSLAVDCPPLPEEVYVDRDMWEKIVLNLLSNAFKFTFEGEIAVSLRQADGEVVLAVRDTGTGIPEAELPHIFERFHHVKNARARTHEGTGIGLALVQELVKLHSGRIEVESRLGEGTTFRVRLPFGREHLPADRIEAPRARATTSVGAAPFVEEAVRWLPDPASGDAVAEPPAIPAGDLPFPPQDGKETARVLVAEDNADMREYLRQLLAGHWAVEAVADGAAALAAATRNPPDLVLADVMMPGLDGFELLRRLRAEPATREIPIVLLSARAGEEARVEGLAAGADDCLIKPFSARELVTRIGTFLELNRVRREAAEKIAEERQRFSAVVENSPVGICAWRDPDLVCELANPAYRLFAPGKEFLGRTYADIWPEALDPFVSIIKRVMETGEPYRAMDVPVCIRKHPDGSPEERFFNIFYAALPPDASGRPGVLHLAVETTEQVRAREALRASEERLRRAVSIDTVGVLFFSLNGRLQNANDAFERMSGYTRRELADLENWMALTVPEFVGVTERTGADLAERGFTEPYEKQMIRKDGSRWWGLFAPTRLSGSGRESECVEFVIDITNQKQTEAALREGEQRYRNLFEQNTAVMLLIDPVSGRVVDANSAACTYYGYKRDKITALKITDINILPDDLVKMEMQKAKTAQQGRFNFQHRLADGRIRDVEVFAGPIVFGGRELIYSIVHDVTDRKKAEEKIERLNADLAARASELAEANRELETFNYSVAHDLRTPLTVISGYLELTQQGCEMTGECRQYVQSAHEGTRKMEQLIDGLLEFSRVSREEPKHQKIDLGAMAQEIIHELQVAEPERRVTVRITEDGMAEGDPRLLLVVLTNLLGNAWKYTRMREQAQIEFSVKKQEGRKIFFVRDNGTGFDMTEAEKLFVPFQRLSGAAEFRGHGVGLATVARIINRHGGRIWADGEPGKGATFYFTLPN